MDFEQLVQVVPISLVEDEKMRMADDYAESIARAIGAGLARDQQGTKNPTWIYELGVLKYLTKIIAAYDPLVRDARLQQMIDQLKTQVRGLP